MKCFMRKTNKKPRKKWDNLRNNDFVFFCGNLKMNDRSDFKCSLNTHISNN